MQNDFLKIPGFDYEVNSECVVRNIKTGCILKTSSRNHVSLFKDGERFQRANTTWRDMAVHANDEWVTLESLDGLYEINRDGVIRNKSSCHVLKSGRVKSGGKVVTVDKKKALAEAFNVGYSKVTVSRRDSTFHFPTFSECAAFLAGKIPLVKSTIQSHLSKRIESIEGWKINYDD